MRRKICTALVILALLVLAMPMAALAQNGRVNSDTRGLLRRGKNGIRLGDVGLNLFDGPGILNYSYKHRWMEGPAGAATVIGIGAGAGAATGGIVKGKKGAVIGALAGGAAATGIWLYKNRTEKRRIF